MTKYFVLIKADINDGDYVYSSTLISSKDCKKLQEILDKMPKNSCNQISYETGEIGDDNVSDDYNYITKEEKDFLSKYLPFGDPNYPGIHTICEVQILREVVKIV